MCLEDITDKTNALRQIPGAKKIENVETFLQDKDANEVNRILAELLLKYKYLERTYESKMLAYEKKIEEAMNTIEIVKVFKKREENPDSKDLELYFPLEENLYAKGVIPKTDKLLFWLGVDLMVEYSLDETLELLEKHMKASINNQKENEKELSWIETQIEITQFNLQQIENYIKSKIKIPEQPERKVEVSGTQKI